MLNPHTHMLSVKLQQEKLLLTTETLKKTQQKPKHRKNSKIEIHVGNHNWNTTDLPNTNVLLCKSSPSAEW